MKSFFIALLFMLSANVGASTLFSLTPTDGDVDAVDLTDLTAYPDPMPLFALVDGLAADPNTVMKLLIPTAQAVVGTINLPSLSFSHVPLGVGFQVGAAVLPTEKFNLVWQSPSDGDWHFADTVEQKGADSYLLSFKDTAFGPASLTNPTAALLVSDIQPQVVAAVPIPAAAWLFGSGLIGLTAVGRRRE